MTMRTHGTVVVLLLGLSGCLPDARERCADGSLCPQSQVCAPSGGGCVTPVQLEVCDGRAEGDACDLPGLGAGRCRDAVCVIATCGDATVDPGEVCDDGNRVDGDGCSAFCSSLETCGNGVRDGGAGDATTDTGDAGDAGDAAGQRLDLVRRTRAGDRGRCRT